MTRVLLLVFVLALVKSDNDEEQDSYFDEPFSLGGAGIKNSSMRWPDNTIPVDIDLPPASKDIFVNAMNHIRGRTCIRFKKWVYQHDKPDYIIVRQPMDRPKHCFSDVGKIGKNQTLYLGSDCNSTKIHLRLLVNAIGFYDEQSRSDRDDYVTINDEFILHNGTCPSRFNKFSKDVVSAFGVSYDYNSIMHGSSNLCSKDGINVTITTMDPDVTIGEAQTLSNFDIKKICNMYCPGTQGIRIQNVANGKFLQVDSDDIPSRIVTAADWTGEENQNWTVDWSQNAMRNPENGSGLISWKQDKTMGFEFDRFWLMTEHENNVQCLAEASVMSMDKWWVERVQHENKTTWRIFNKQSSNCITSTSGTAVRTESKNLSNPNQLWRIWNA